MFSSNPLQTLNAALSNFKGAGGVITVTAGVKIHHHRLEASLEKMPAAPMAPIEPHAVAALCNLAPMTQLEISGSLL